MTRAWVIDNLRETIEHINTAIGKVEEDNEDGFEAWMPFIYRDLNRAWNGRNIARPPMDGPEGELLCHSPADLDVAD